MRTYSVHVSNKSVFRSQSQTGTRMREYPWARRTTKCMSFIEFVGLAALRQTNTGQRLGKDSAKPNAR